MMQLRGKLVTSRLIREEEEEEENWLRGKLVTSRLIREEGEEEENWLRCDSITSRFHYVAIPLHLGIGRSPCLVTYQLNVKICN
jgi:hypothetical protein